jgi:hypothetical protein
MENDTPAVKANQLLRFILEHQTNLFTPVLPSAKNGDSVAEFINQLRQGLIAMYTKTPGA